MPGGNSRHEIGPILTHTITRGDLFVTVTEQGTLESSNNTEIKCKVRGQSTVIWVIEGGTEVKPGDELVRLDTLALQDAIAERTKYAHLTRSGAERARADVARAELAIPEYLQGRYRAQLMTMEKDLAIAESNLRTAQNILGHTVMMAERGYASDLLVEEKTFAVTRTTLAVEVQKTQIDVLKEYTKKIEMKTLQGELNAAKARLAAEEERAKMDAIRLKLAEDELEHCVIRAERSGLVIYPSAAQWKNTPEIEEGATAHKDQVLLLIPDLSQMQVKVGIHESIIDRIKPGLTARVTLPERTLDGTVSSVASVTRPAGWWTGNVVKYDTIVELPSVEGLKPGMSAEVEVIMDRHEDVLTIPAAAVVETAEGDFCWLKTAEGVQRRRLQLGDTDDSFLVVLAGVEEGDQVVLHPLASIEEAQSAALKPLEDN
jgi:multidrug efflux pump subunit AcrA (membrane-fusion protein)